MRYCLSDIHGNYDLFIKLLEKINLKDNDELLVLGDIIDKGEQSVHLLHKLFSMTNVKCIMGNHEYDFLKYYNGLMQHSTDNTDYNQILKTLQNYFPSDGHLLTWDLIYKLEELPVYLEYNDCVCVHAGVVVAKDGSVLPLKETSTEEFVYNRFFKECNKINYDKCIIFGHTPVRYLVNKDRIVFYPRNLKKGRTTNICDYYKINIDMGVYLSGVLGCLRIEDCKTFYVNK